jgi:hypothetical protein
MAGRPANEPDDSTFGQIAAGIWPLPAEAKVRLG